MSSLTPRLGLKRPDDSDDFLSEDQYDLLTLLDQYPGIFVCDFATRPVGWGGSQSGNHIWETDRELLWRWNGSAFVRAHPLGQLGLSEITSDFSTASTSAVTAISSVVDVPATNAGSTTKRIKVEASWYGLDNGTLSTLGACEVTLRRDPSDVVLKKVLWRGRPTTATSPLDWGGGGTIVGWDAPAAGSTTYKLSINSIAAVGGTSTLRASATAVASLSVEEVGL